MSTAHATIYVEDDDRIEILRVRSGAIMVAFPGVRRGVVISEEKLRELVALANTFLDDYRESLS